MRVLLRMYGPAIVIAVWCLAVLAFGLSRDAGVIAGLTVAVSVKVQVDEARRQHLEHRRRSHR